VTVASTGHADTFVRGCIALSLVDVCVMSGQVQRSAHVVQAIFCRFATA
jgi:hypothetical protein